MLVFEIHVAKLQTGGLRWKEWVSLMTHKFSFK